MMKFNRGFIRDLGKIFTVLNEEFFLGDLQIAMEEKMDTYGGDKEYLDAYILKFNRNGKNICLEIRGDEFVHASVEGKIGRSFDLYGGNEERRIENIHAFIDYIQG